MATSIPTAYLFFAAAIALLALPKGQARGLLLLAVPLIAALHVWNLPEGSLAQQLSLASTSISAASTG